MAFVELSSPLLADVEQMSQCSDSCSSGPIPCSETHADTCPPGLFCKKGHCECGTYPDKMISCNGTSSMVLRYNCVTFDESKGVTLVGNCVHIMNNTSFNKNYSGDTLYHQLPSNVHRLDDTVCKSLNRTGIQCGECLPHHYPLAYSFKMNCIPCPHAHWNWLKYITAAYLPLTLFCILILFFKVNVTSSHLFAVVYYCRNALSIAKFIFSNLPRY